MSPAAIVDREQALVVERGAEDGRPVRRDDLGAAPERDRLVDADAVAEDHERRRQLRVGAHQRPPRGRGAEADLVRRGEVAARRRRHVDEDLGAVEREDLGHAEVPEVLADADPDPDAQPGRHRPQHVAGREEAPLVEQPVRRQEELAVDVPDLAVLEQRGGDEQPVVGRLLDERDDRRQAAGLGGEGRQPRVVEPHRDLAGEVLEQVAGQPELREDDEVRAPGACLLEERVVALQVRVEVPESRRDLGEGDRQRGLHGASIARRPFDRHPSTPSAG